MAILGTNDDKSCFRKFQSGNYDRFWYQSTQQKIQKTAIIPTECVPNFVSCQYRDKFRYYLSKNVRNKQCDGIDLLKYQRKNPYLPFGSAFSSCCCWGSTLALAGAFTGALRAMLEVAFAHGRIQLYAPLEKVPDKMARTMVFLVQFAPRWHRLCFASSF
jgi:hypothetical protein